MDIFTNKNEGRLRTIWRLVAFIAITFFAILPIVIISSELGIPEIYPALLWKIAVIGTVLFTALKIDKRSLKSLGVLIDRIWMREFILGTCIAALAMTLIFLLFLAMDWIEVTGYGWSRPGFWSGFIVFLFHMVLVGIWEEMAFRGYFITNIAEGITSKNISVEVACLAAIVLTSFFFGFVHLNNPNADWSSTINIMLAGFVLAVPFILTGQLALSIGLHFSWNFFQGGIFGFQVSGKRIEHTLFRIREIGPDTWTGGQFGPEAGISGMLGLALLLILVIMYTRKADYNMDVNLTLKKSDNDTGRVL